MTNLQLHNIRPAWDTIGDGAIAIDTVAAAGCGGGGLVTGAGRCGDVPLGLCDGPETRLKLRSEGGIPQVS